MQIVKTANTKRILFFYLWPLLALVVLSLVLIGLKLSHLPWYNTIRTTFMTHYENQTDVHAVIQQADLSNENQTEKTDMEEEISWQESETTVAESDTQTVVQPLLIEQRLPVAQNSLVIPVQGCVSSPFGMRNDPFTNRYKKHNGMDIAAQSGTPIYAVADGIVSFVGFDGTGYGNYLTVAHTDHVKTLYGHCSRICVTKGQSVCAGDIIAYVGSTGGSTGPHLHFEIRLDGVPVNPAWYITVNE